MTVSELIKQLQALIQEDASNADLSVFHSDIEEGNVLSTQISIEELNTMIINHLGIKMGLVIG